MSFPKWPVLVAVKQAIPQWGAANIEGFNVKLKVLKFKCLPPHSLMIATTRLARSVDSAGANDKSHITRSSSFGVSMNK